MKNTYKDIVNLFKSVFAGFSDDNVTKLSGSLAYSTVFSLGPLLIIIISLCSIFLGKAAVEGKIYAQLAQFIGGETATQLQQLIKNAALNGKSKIAFAVGAIALLIGATAVFSEIQGSINIIWGIKSKPKKGWLKFLQNRFLSFSVIVSLGFLLLISLTINSVVDALNNRLQMHFQNITIVVFYVANFIITFIITSVIFAVIFKVLPDAIIKWKDIIAGAVGTALLFMLGKFVISFYITKSNVGSTYGAAGSLVILLLWVYYSSIILYLGAEITKAYVTRNGGQIQPNEYAVTIKTIEGKEHGN